MVDAEVDDTDQLGIEAELLDCSVAHELADHDHPVCTADRSRPRDRAEGTLRAREHLRQVEVLHVEQRRDRRLPHLRQPQCERVVHDVSAFEPCA